MLATTTYNNDCFPFMRTFVEHLTERNYQNRTVALIENGTWAPAAAKTIKGLLANAKGISFAEPVVTIRSALNDASRAQSAARSTPVRRRRSRGGINETSGLATVPSAPSARHAA